MGNNDQISFPKWFVAIAPYFFSGIALVLTAAVPWAWTVQNTLTIIATKLESQQEMNRQMLQEHSRRIEDHEIRIRAVEKKP